MLNNNMRCFEIVMGAFGPVMVEKLNNNMRCFEIRIIMGYESMTLTVKQ